MGDNDHKAEEGKLQRGLKATGLVGKKTCWWLGGTGEANWYPELKQTPSCKSFWHHNPTYSPTEKLR